MILFMPQPYVQHIPNIEDGHSSRHIILEKERKKSSSLPDNTFFISSTKQPERPTDNSWLLPASFKAGAVTWMSHFYFIHFFIGMVSARRSIRSLRREDKLRWRGRFCVSAAKTLSHTSHRPSDHTTIRHSSTLSLLSQNWRIIRPLGLCGWKEKESWAFRFLSYQRMNLTNPSEVTCRTRQSMWRIEAQW